MHSHEPAPAWTPGGGVMGIGDAVARLWGGGRVRRAGWNGKGMWLALAEYGAGHWYDGDADKATHTLDPFVVMRTAGGTYVPWLCSQTDLLADDWEPAT